ncbi:dihydropteroate synthase [Komagataeibacter medellinensis]|uniref:Dihydropteroate synthase n=1 Tax=Komagataeibacter medellinensis (strain NBRC 3288 / BCRC 11682 / LMG 1693 / Kondo 51) TaxID=634177 RepID=G2I6J8_KOMMN|nr:dihydropteroate synthase [Komagataeibacter medellinensis]BAK83745.1 dihydropteroate synthase [Komagataeibacter medellinensis NBRC 3288]
MDNPLIEPLALLRGSAAQQAVAAGQARWLAGGPHAYALARLLGGDGAGRIVPACMIAPHWAEAALRVSLPAPDAGLPPGPQVMGIINVTPDSFSDGGQHYRVRPALESIQAMYAAGCRIVDIGGESTRPGAPAVSVDEEWRRIGPVIRAVRDCSTLADLRLSIDTRQASVMDRALDAGADVINDVSALTHDPAARTVVARHGCPVMLMHMRGTPATMAAHAEYEDVAVDVLREISVRVDEAVAAGIDRARILVDPGIGFAKTMADNLNLLARLPLLANLGCRVVVGVSRKRMLGEICHEPDALLRDPATVAASLSAMVFPHPVLRVHNVGAMMQAVQVSQGLDRP